MTDHTGTLVPFNYGDAQVRVVTIEGEPWFVLADLTKVLGIRQFRADRLDDGLIQNHPIPDALGRVQNATVVSEPGMYEVVIRSDKPEAAAFRRWITGTVLPVDVPEDRDERRWLADELVGTYGWSVSRAASVLGFRTVDLAVTS